MSVLEAQLLPEGEIQALRTLPAAVCFVRFYLFDRRVTRLKLVWMAGQILSEHVDVALRCLALSCSEPGGLPERRVSHLPWTCRCWRLPGLVWSGRWCGCWHSCHVITMNHIYFAVWLSSRTSSHLLKCDYMWYIVISFTLLFAKFWYDVI